MNETDNYLGAKLPLFSETPEECVLNCYDNAPLRASFRALIAECTAYDFKVMLEEKKPKSWLKSVSAFANGLGGSLFFGIDNDGIIFASTDTPNVGDHDGDMSETKLIERQQKILNLIKESPTITGRQMSDTLSVSQRTIERDLSALQKMGILKHEGKDNDGMWCVKVSQSSKS